MDKSVLNGEFVDFYLMPIIEMKVVFFLVGNGVKEVKLSENWNSLKFFFYLLFFHFILIFLSHFHP